MNISPKQKQILIQKIGQNFRTFGGGRTSNWNPIANALADKPYQFAAGVDVKEVVDFILKELHN